MSWRDAAGFPHLLGGQHQFLDGRLRDQSLPRPPTRTGRLLRFRGEHESLHSARSTRRTRQVHAIEPTAKSIVAFRVDARVGEGALSPLQKSVLFLLQGLTGSIERRLRRGDPFGGRLDFGGAAPESLTVDIGEANVGERRGEESEQGLDGIRDRAGHSLNILSAYRPGKNTPTCPWLAASSAAKASEPPAGRLAMPLL